MTTILGSILGAISGIIVASIAAIVALGNRKAAPYGELAARVVYLEKRDEEKTEQIEGLRTTINQLRTTGDQQAAQIVALDADVGVLASELWEFHAWDGTPPSPKVGDAALEIMRRRRPIETPPRKD